MMRRPLSHCWPLRISTDSARGYAYHEAFFADLLHEGCAGTVVRDREPKGRVALRHLDLLLVSLNVGEEEVIQANLATKEAGHLNLVGVEGAVENLHGRGILSGTS